MNATVTKEVKHERNLIVAARYEAVQDSPGWVVLNMTTGERCGDSYGWTLRFPVEDAAKEFANAKNREALNEAEAANISNALVEQKGMIINVIDCANDAAGLEAASNLLLFAAPVWEASGYWYKMRELRDRLKRRAEDMRYANLRVMSGLRKNGNEYKIKDAQNARLRAIEAM